VVKIEKREILYWSFEASNYTFRFDKYVFVFQFNCPLLREPVIFLSYFFSFFLFFLPIRIDIFMKQLYDSATIKTTDLASLKIWGVHFLLEAENILLENLLFLFIVELIFYEGAKLSDIPRKKSFFQ
jgi:hypothetical protein